MADKTRNSQPGETGDNKTRTIAGHNTGALTPTGVQQATLLAERLRDSKFDFIFTSDLNRTKQTAQIIHSMQQPGTLMQEDFRLREKGSGDLEGKPLGTCEKMAKKTGTSIRSYRPPGGGESWDDVCTRSRSFMSDLTKLIASEGLRSVLVVTHGGWIKEFINAHVPSAKAANSSRNCSISILKASGSSTSHFRFQVVSMNDAAHLKGLSPEGGIGVESQPGNQEQDQGYQ